ncbi:MAG: putative sulfate/molybdate transporter [Halolamina sp.]
MGLLAFQSYRRSISFSRGELTGAIGDSVTVLPIAVAIGALTELSLGRMLLGFAAFQVIWGLRYGLPVSVEPMKALAALVVAGALSPNELVVAGLLAGVALLLLGATRSLGKVAEYIGEPVVRGVQLAVALILLETGVRLSLDALPVAVLGVVAAGAVTLAGYRRASALGVLALGVGLALLGNGVPALQVPAFVLSVPATSAFTRPAVEATVAQLAMTVGNAAVATSLLLSQYYDADASPDELATSMGVMNLLAVPLGALPMCHGSGGVAGKHAFGARTAGANLILGGLYAVAALSAGAIAAFPLAVLGVVLALVAAELGRAGLDTTHLPTTVAIGVLGLLTNVGVAFLAGTVGYLLLERRRSAQPAPAT